MTGPAAVPQIVRWIEGEIARTGRRYRIDWSKLDLAELREVQSPVARPRTRENDGGQPRPAHAVEASMIRLPKDPAVDVAGYCGRLWQGSARALP